MHAWICDCGTRNAARLTHCWSCRRSMLPAPVAPTIRMAPKWRQSDAKVTPKRFHSAAVAGLLGFLLVGGGQMYNEQWTKGWALAIASVFLLLCGAWLYPLLWITATIDGVLIAKKIRRGEPVAPWQWS